MKPILETDRLILREVDIDRDLDAWVDMMSDEDTVRFIGGQTMDHAASWRQMANPPQLHAARLCQRSRGCLCGLCV